MQGVERVQRGLDQLKAGLDKVDAIAQKARLAFAALTGTVGGFVRAGLAGTTAGEQLRLSFQLFSQQIASIFLPTIRAVASALERLTGWFKALDGDQQAFIRRTVEGAAAALLVASVLPAAIGLISGGLSVAVKLLTAEMLALDVVTGGILPAIGLLVTGLTFLAVGTKTGRDALAELGRALVPLAGALHDAWAEISRALAPAMADLRGAVAEVMPHIVQAVRELAPARAELARAAAPFVAMLIRIGAAATAAVWKTLATALEVLVPLWQTNIRLMSDFYEQLMKIAQLVPGLGLIAQLAPGLGLIAGLVGGGIARKGRQDVGASGGQFEDITAAWKRVQAGALKTENKVPEEQLAEQKAIRRRLDELADRVGWGAAAAAAAAAVGP